jgi:hypothetical protein
MLFLGKVIFTQVRNISIRKFGKERRCNLKLEKEPPYLG